MFNPVLVGAAVMAAEDVAAGALTPEVVTAVSNGLSNMSATATQVILLAVPVTIGVVCLSKGVEFAIRKVASVLSHAQ